MVPQFMFCAKIRKKYRRFFDEIFNFYSRKKKSLYIAGTSLRNSRARFPSFLRVVSQCISQIYKQNEHAAYTVQLFHSTLSTGSLKCKNVIYKLKCWFFNALDGLVGKPSTNNSCFAQKEGQTSILKTKLYYIRGNKIQFRSLSIFE